MISWTSNPGYIFSMGLPWWLSSKESTYQLRRHGSDPWVGKISWRRSPWNHSSIRTAVRRVGHDLATKQQQIHSLTTKLYHLYPPGKGSIPVTFIKSSHSSVDCGKRTPQQVSYQSSPKLWGVGTIITFFKTNDSMILRKFSPIFPLAETSNIFF